MNILMNRVLKPVKSGILLIGWVQRADLVLLGENLEV